MRGVASHAAVLLAGAAAWLGAVEAGAQATLSAASERALTWPEDGREWFGVFHERDLKGDFAYEEGVIRRDPSAVLRVEGLYHVWYTKGVGETAGFGTGDPHAKVYPWDLTEVWHATSPDGWTWTERGLAVGRGPTGSYDDRAVFTPEVLADGGKYYLFYQTVKAPYLVRTKNRVGVAVADWPEGPWKKSPEPILRPSDDGEWLGEEDDRRSVLKRGSFDSHKVHDPCVLPYRGKYYLYYKGQQMGEPSTHGGRDIRWGVAIADHPLGPYRKSPMNPVTNSGHEVCVWRHRGGVAALLTTDGPEKNTIQYAADGLNFEIKAVPKSPPKALGLVRSLDVGGSPVAALGWGLCHAHRGGWQHIRRFSFDSRFVHATKGEKRPPTD